MTVVDLELLGTGPAGLDLCQLWCGLADPQDRDRVLAALREVPGAEPDVLLPWVALRSLADVTAAVPRAERRPEVVHQARQAWDDARRLTGRGPR